jgi:hypothetical protein
VTINQIDTSLSAGITLTSDAYADPFTITNTGSIHEASTNGVASAETFTLFNNGAVYGADDGVTLQSGVVSNTGTIAGGLQGLSVYTSGTVTNAAGATVMGGVYGLGVSSGASVFNAGTIASQSATRGAAASIYANSSLTNVSGGSIVGGFDGVYMVNSTLRNQAGATITGGNFGVAGYFYDTVVNAGNIQGSVVGIDVLFSGGSGPSMVDNTGTIGGGTIGVYLGLGGSVTNEASGTITAVEGVTLAGTAGTLINAGIVIGTGGTAAVLGATGYDRLVLGAGASFTGIVEASNATAANTIELKAGASTGTLSGLGSEYVGFQSITIDSGAAWSLAGSAAAFGTTAIDGFNSHDRLDLTNLTFNAGDTATLNGGNQLVITDAGGNVTIQTDSAVTGHLFTLVSDGHAGTLLEETNYTPCYLRGTRILTANGQLRVEDLRIGDRVVTLGGEILPIKWIGRRGYRDWLALGNPEVQPILFKAGAIADHVPKRDLYVSPEHAMFLDGLLIPAHLLVNGTSIAKVEGLDDVEYFHLEFDRHVVILAEGAAAESFVDDDSRMLFHNADEYRRLYPDEPPRLEAQFCAPRVEAGEALENVHRRLAGRSSRLRADGTAVPPHRRGFVDRATRTTIEGWALPESGPAKLAILVNGAVVGRTVADRYRADIEGVGIGDGRCAFRFELPHPLTRDIGHCIEVRHDDDWSLLHHGRVSLRPSSA